MFTLRAATVYVEWFISKGNYLSADAAKHDDGWRLDYVPWPSLDAKYKRINAFVRTVDRALLRYYHHQPNLHNTFTNNSIYRLHRLLLRPDTSSLRLAWEPLRPSPYETLPTSEDDADW
jgi:hypothetical protein